MCQDGAPFDSFDGSFHQCHEKILMVKTIGRHPFFRWWVLAFFRSWNSEGLLLLRSKLFLLSPAPIHTNTRGGDQNMQGIGCYALKISMIEKTPTPHHRKNAALPPLPLLRLYI